MKRILFTLVAVVSAAATANAASITMTADASTYNISDTITLTVVYDSEGEATESVQAAFTFEPSLVSFQSATVETAASFGGALDWSVGGPCGMLAGFFHP